MIKLKLLHSVLNNRKDFMEFLSDKAMRLKHLFFGDVVDVFRFELQGRLSLSFQMLKHHTAKEMLNKSVSVPFTVFINRNFNCIPEFKSFHSSNITNSVLW
jgi:hypothetical protein